jgi:hypothetical protein
VPIKEVYIHDGAHPIASSTKPTIGKAGRKNHKINNTDSYSTCKLITTQPAATVNMRTNAPIIREISWSNTALKATIGFGSLVELAEICRNGANKVAKSWPIEKN